MKNSENLLFGLTPDAESSEPFKHFTDEEKLVENLKAVTDGENLKPDIFDRRFVRFFKGGVRSLTFDLGAETEIGAVGASFMQDSALGIFTPEVLNISVSTDKKTFSGVYSIKSKIRPDSDTVCVSSFEAGQEKFVKARYLRFEFDCRFFAFTGKVFANRPSEGAKEAKLLPEKKASSPIGFPKEGRNGKSLVYLYCGRNKPAASAFELLPFAGYINETGKISDTMFDTFCLLTDNAYVPAGDGGYYSTNGEGQSKDEKKEKYFDSFLFRLFEEKTPDGREGILGALNAAAEKVNEALSLPGRKIGVRPEIPGNGLSDSEKAKEKFIKAFLEKFKEKNYRALKPDGFMRRDGDEPIPHYDADCKDAVKLNEFIHSQKQKSYISLGCMAQGYADFRENGYDGAYMRCGYVFSEKNRKLLSEFALCCKNHGIAPETELPRSALICDGVKGRGTEKFLDCLRESYSSDFIGCDCAFYQGAESDSLTAFKRLIPDKNRELYENTYLFLKGTLMPGIPKVKCSRFKRRRDGCYEAVLRTDSKSDIFAVDTVFGVECRCAHGAAVIRGKDKIIFIPDRTFTGIDKVKVFASSHGVESDTYVFYVSDLTRYAVKKSAVKISDMSKKKNFRTAFTCSLAAGIAAVVLYGKLSKDDKKAKSEKPIRKDV